MHYVMASASTAATTVGATAPWWGKVLIGFSLVIIGAVLSWMSHTKKISFGDLTDWVAYLLVVLMGVGVCVMLWGLGVNFSS